MTAKTMNWIKDRLGLRLARGRLRVIQGRDYLFHHNERMVGLR